MAGQSVSISVKPAIATPKDRIKSGQTEDCVERPCPPYSPCHIKVCVGTRFNFSAAGQNSYVVQQILGRDFQAALGGSGLQVFKRKASPPNHLLPKMDPTKTEPAPAVVKYPSLTRYNGLRFTVRQCH